MTTRYLEISFTPTPGMPDGPSIYSVTARDSQDRLATERVVVNLEELVRREEQLHLASKGTKAGTRQLEELTEELGQGLFDAFFARTVRDLLFFAFGAVNPDQTSLQVRLRFCDQVSELAALSWEYLYWPAGHRFWALTDGLSIVRCLDLPDDGGSLRREFPLKLLVASGSSGVQGLNLQAHQRAVDEPLAALLRHGLLERQLLWKAGAETLAEILGDGRLDMFHLVAHGDIAPSEQRGVIFLQDLLPQGLAVTGRELASMLSRHPPRLVVLIVCKGGAASGQSLFDGVAQDLVLRGVPAVVAIRASIREDYATRFVRSFYHALATGESLDRAVYLGRMRLRVEDPVAWATPALFLRSRDSRLFDLPRYFGHPFARQMLEIEEVLESDPARALAVLCQVPLKHRSLGREGATLLSIREELCAARARGQLPDSLTLCRKIRRFLELLAQIPNCCP